MTKILDEIKTSVYVFLGIGFVTTLAVAMLVAAPYAKAESPNILAGPNLMLGSSGQSVVVLQGLLSEMGYLTVPNGIAFGYYGQLTRSAVANYQAANNVYPSVGYFGSLTKSAMYSDFARHGWLRLLGWQ